uniref:Tc3 transposase DNA binding domain-containing protein n=1 Tax=Panagrolaimus sp. JU765 TaxID=591449 RepID=A0AC34R8S8_9BILA
MGRGKKLSDYEKGVITGLAESKLTHAEIAVRIHRSQNVVSNFLRRRDEYGTAKSPGRPKKLSGKARRRIVQKKEIEGKSISFNKTTQRFMSAVQPKDGY